MAQLFQSDGSCRPDTGLMQGPQGLLQTLLELGEAFLASEIGEDDLQDLEAKLSAARSRDYNTIRDLQKKIEELSGMNAMVSRLKDELREEKEKAKEEAEDLTQEMAELRYQLMERVEQERELRAHTEQASLRRISELEEQLKHARQKILSLLGRKQTAEPHARVRERELGLQLIQSAFEDSPSSYYIKDGMELQIAPQCLLDEHLNSELCTSYNQENETPDVSLKVNAVDVEELVKENKHLQLQLSTVVVERDMAFEKLQSLSDSLSTSGSISTACDKEQEQVWTVQAAVEIVEFVTEEMTKLLRLLLKHPLSRKTDFLSSLESRLQLWSNIPQKSLPRKVLENGALPEWADLVVDLVGHARRELQALQQKVLDLETEVEIMDKSRAELHTLSKELTCTKEELVKAESHFAHEMGQNKDLIHALEGELQQTHVNLRGTQNRVKEQEVTICSLHGQLCKLELEVERSKSTWTLEKKQLDETLREQCEKLQKERTKASKDVDKLEKRVEKLLQRVAENEQELEELMPANSISVDAVVEAKLRRLEQNLNESVSIEAQVQAERAELASQVVWLQAKLEEAEHELEVENEQHVEVLIQYEEERGIMEAELEAAKHSVHVNQVEIEQASIEKAISSLQDKSTITVQECMEEKSNMHRSTKVGELRRWEDKDLLLERKLWYEAEMKEKDLRCTLDKTLAQLSATQSDLESERQKIEHLEESLRLSVNKLSRATRDGKTLQSDLESERHKIEHLEESLRLSVNKLSRATRDGKTLQDTIEALTQKVLEKDNLLASLNEELFLQKERNKNLTSHASYIDTELLNVKQQLLLCESEANEMGLTIVNLQEALMLERMKTTQALEEMNLQTKRLSRQDEDFLHLKMKYNTLLMNLNSLQANLRESRKREGEACAQVKKLGLELSVAKEEVLKSEMRLQKILKQKEEKLDAERGKLETVINAQNQSNWLLQRQIEQLKSLEAEKMELQRLLGQVRGNFEQVEKERDDLKVAYAELENQFSRRRAAFSS